MSKCTMRIDVTTTRTVGNKFVLHGIQRKQWSKWNVEHTIQNHYNKLNTQTLTSHYIRIFITEMFASQWQQLVKQISSCKFSLDVLKMPPPGNSYTLWAQSIMGHDAPVSGHVDKSSVYSQHTRVTDRQTWDRQTYVRQTDGRETDRQTDVRKTDVRQTDRHDTGR